MTIRMIALFISSVFILNAQAIDITPYKVGQKLTIKQAEELKSRYKQREQQHWLDAPMRESINSEKNATQIQYGIELLENTFISIGPKVADKNKRYSGNSLNCSSCHLKGPTGLPGSKKFALPFTNVMNDYPNFRARSMSIGSPADRVNGCMTRSMGAGTPLPNESKEMQAILSYFTWLAKGSDKNKAMDGVGLPKLKLPQRMANVTKGKEIYSTYCMACHGDNGLGTKTPDYAKTGLYTFPPIAGDNSFNNGAGMSRLIKATRFIHANMPLGISYQTPALTVDDAYDVAAYVESLERPEKSGRENDFSVVKFRPVDYPVPAFFNGNEKALEKAKHGPFEQ